MSYRIHINAPDNTGSTYYRVWLPVKHCRKQLELYGIELTCDARIDPDGYDAYGFQRILKPEYLPYLYRLYLTGKKIFWDVDDHMWGIPESSPAFKAVGKDGLINGDLCMSEFASVLTASTAPLAEVVHTRFQQDVTVLPNLIDPRPYWRGTAPAPSGRLPKKKVLWAGSPTHDEDLAPVAKAVKTIAARRDDVLFNFIGYRHKELEEMPPDRVMFMNGCPITYYPSMLCSLAPDIALLPLAESEFNLCKSSIKYYEMTLAGATCIASDFGPYTICDRRVCGNDPYKWGEMINDLLDNLDSFQHVKINEVISYYSWKSSLANQWIDFFRSLAD